MLTEKNGYIRKSVFILFLMFLCLQGASCGREKIIIQSDYNETQNKVDESTDIVKNTVESQLEDIANCEEDDAVDDKYFIYVCGAVKFPGVYQMDPEARVYEAIDKAGGLNEDAEESAINLALHLEDGQMIYVPTLEEVQNGSFSTEGEMDETGDAGLVNINTAGVDELTTLNGVGKVKATAIIEYRQNNGAFNSIEDIMKVTGIGQGSFDKIKNQIKVK